MMPARGWITTFKGRVVFMINQRTLHGVPMAMIKQTQKALSRMTQATVSNLLNLFIDEGFHQRMWKP
jgi:hypothetical protein